MTRCHRRPLAVKKNKARGPLRSASVDPALVAFSVTPCLPDVRGILAGASLVPRPSPSLNGPISCSSGRLDKSTLEVCANHPLDGPELRINRHRLCALRDRGVWILEAVTGERTDNGAPFPDAPKLEILHYTSKAGG